MRNITKPVKLRKIAYFVIVSLAVVLLINVYHIDQRTTMDEIFFSATGYNRNHSLSTSHNVPSWIHHLCPPFHKTPSPLKPITLSWRPPNPDIIFFTQTSCQVVLSSREACSVESTARHHRNQTILLYFTAPAVEGNNHLMEVLLQLPNLQMAWLDLDTLFNLSGLLHWHTSRQWLLNEKRSNIFISDAVRISIMALWGGTYVDLDALTLKPFPKASTWLSRIRPGEVNSAVSHAIENDAFFQEVLSKIPERFDPETCCSIGPYLVTGVLQKFCPDTFVLSESSDPEELLQCRGITVFPRSMFYPISFGYYEDELVSIFNAGRGLGPKFLRETNATSLHLFHSLSHKRPVPLGGDTVLEEVARINCPSVYKTLNANKMFL